MEPLADLTNKRKASPNFEQEPPNKRRKSVTFADAKRLSKVYTYKTSLEEDDSMEMTEVLDTKVEMVSEQEQKSETERPGNDAQLEDSFLQQDHDDSKIPSEDMEITKLYEDNEDSLSYLNFLDYSIDERVTPKKRIQNIAAAAQRINEDNTKVQKVASSPDPKNITVEHFLNLLNIHLGTSASFASKRISMHISKSNKKPETFEDFVHLGVIDSQHKKVLEEACDELDQKYKDEEERLSLIEKKLNQKNPDIFKIIQTHPQGSQEFRHVQQKVLTLKSYVRELNRYEHLQWKLELERRKQQYIRNQQNLIENDIEKLDQDTRIVLRENEELQRNLLHPQESKKFPEIQSRSIFPEKDILNCFKVFTKHISVTTPNPRTLNFHYQSMDIDINVSFDQNGLLTSLKFDYQNQHSNNDLLNLRNSLIKVSGVVEMLQRSKTIQGLREVMLNHVNFKLNRIRNLYLDLVSFQRKGPCKFICQFSYDDEDHVKMMFKIFHYDSVILRYKKFDLSVEIGKNMMSRVKIGHCQNIQRFLVEEAHDKFRSFLSSPFGLTRYLEKMANECILCDNSLEQSLDLSLGSNDQSFVF